jgi:predicted ATPase
MLKQWCIAGFKAFGEQTCLNLAPITIFAGANSSGKSSIIQSILLLKQTVQYGSSNRPLALNGPLIRLGTFDDILHSGTRSGELSLAFRFSADQIGHVDDRPTWSRHLSRNFWQRRGGIEDILGEFVWKPRKNPAQSSTQLIQSSLVKGEITVRRKRTGDDDAWSESYVRYSPKPNLSYLPDVTSGLDVTEEMEVELDPLSMEEVTEDKPDARIDFLYTQFFLPGAVSVEFNADKQRAKELADLILSSSPSLLVRNKYETIDLKAPVIDAVNDWLSSHGQKPLSHDGITTSDIQEHFKNLNISSGGSRGLFDDKPDDFDIPKLKMAIEDAVLGDQPGALDHEIEIPRSINQASEFVIEFLRRGVRYLGPLRDEPKPVYPLEALEDPKNVGYRGEHTAAVLYLNAGTLIRYVSPEDLQSAGRKTAQSFAPLRTAVINWLVYMGVATDVKADDAGVFGNQLKVSTEGLQKSHDLTNVGVGVSQILPIVVSALLAPATSLLIFEQPELHLHPKVQARLADFFYSVALSGKQCLLETHSEYMIDRFRLRIAEEDNDALRNMLSIYFTERHGHQAKCRAVEITRYGAISDWPKDFFDQSQTETRKILEAASIKRRREKGL